LRKRTGVFLHPGPQSHAVHHAAACTIFSGGNSVYSGRPGRRHNAQREAVREEAKMRALLALITAAAFALITASAQTAPQPSARPAHTAAEIDRLLARIA